VGIVVSNIDSALKFYCDVLGLHIQGKTHEKDDVISQLLDYKNVELKTIKLSADDNSTRIELLEFKNPKSKKLNTISLYDIGFTHIALTVENLDALYERLKKYNIEFNSPPIISPNGALKVIFCRDLEGNFLELIEEI
jgi:extradiol dioxygenase family protein